MIICGCSMEMKLAEEMGWVGKCIGCLYFDCYDGVPSCQKKGRLETEKENCPDWVVDHRGPGKDFIGCNFIHYDKISNIF